MGHWARIDENNIVQEVIVIKEEMLDTGGWGDKSKWIKKEPKNFDSWLSYGKVLHGLGRNEEAKRALEKALSYNPLDANALFTMANVLALVGDGANLKKVREALEFVDPQGVAEGKCNMAC